MPQFRFGNMWTAYVVADLFLVSTNSTIRQDGALVMGRGIARQAKERFPGLDVAMGRQIQALCGNQGIYGLLVSSRWPVAKLGAFQVKRHYSQAASTSASLSTSLELVRRSTAELCTWCVEHPDASIHFNYPGTGNGRLQREGVLPIMAQLPDQVTIWEYSPAGKENAA